MKWPSSPTHICRTRGRWLNWYQMIVTKIIEQTYFITAWIYRLTSRGILVMEMWSQYKYSSHTYITISLYWIFPWNIWGKVFIWFPSMSTEYWPYPAKGQYHCILPHMLLHSKVHGANIRPIWGQQDPGGPHVGPMNLAIWAISGTNAV